MTDVLDIAAMASSEQLERANTVVRMQVLDAIERELARMDGTYSDTVLRLSEAYQRLTTAD